MRVKEQELYPGVAKWLDGRLRSLFPGWQIRVSETSRIKLASFLGRVGLQDAFPGSEAFEIEVDITGLLRRGEKAELAFVEFKTGPISLKDVGQILGYSRVASPALSVVLSPAGMSSSLHLLLAAYNRVDLLEFGGGRRIKVGTWDIARKQLDPVSVFPPGELG